jgi:hypothetical protein
MGHGLHSTEIQSMFLSASGVAFIPIPPKLAAPALGHLRATGITSAKEQDIFFHYSMVAYFKRSFKNSSKLDGYLKQKMMLHSNSPSN